MSHLLDRHLALIVVISFFLLNLIALIGCGPTTFTKEKFRYQSYDKNENKQIKEGITIENIPIESTPPEMIANVQDCDPSDGKLYVDSRGEPVMKKRIILPKNAMFYKIAITNNTGHVVRLNSTVIALFDPADNQFDSLSKNQLSAYLMQERPCPNTNQLINQLNLIKLIGRNTELLPNRTTTGYVIFKPHNLKIPGVWKLSFYELPVETNAAGVVSKTVNFDFRTILKKYIVTYQRDNPLADAVEISTKEVQ